MIVQILEAATTVGELKKQLEGFADDMSFGFRNQPMQHLHHIKIDEFEAVCFQELAYPHQLNKMVQRYWPEGRHPACCKGDCLITATCGIDFCGHCLWSEDDELIETESKK